MAHGPWALALSHPTIGESHGAAIAAGTNPVSSPRLNRGQAPIHPLPKPLSASSPPTGSPASPIKPQGQVDGRAEDASAAVVAGCNGPPVLQSGKKILDSMTLAIHSLAVMDWFLAAATGRDVRWDALLEQHLAVLVAILPLIPDPCGRRRQVFVQHIGTGEVTAIALHAGGATGNHLCCRRP